MTLPVSDSPHHPNNLPVVIFCGGHGTRLKEETELIPKPLVPIGEQPILWHIMKIYYSQGFRKFILLAGYKSEHIKKYFYQYPIHMSDFTIRYKDGVREVAFHNAPAENWEVTIIDTGLMAETGARLFRARNYLHGKPFMLTYGDGVSDVDLRSLVAFHEQNRSVVTVTGVHPPGRFGEIRSEGPNVIYFKEKPNAGQDYINGGFMIVEPTIYRYTNDEEHLNFERDVLPRVAQDGEMTIFPHNGFWQCMDTMRDMETLTNLWKQKDAPWRMWDT